MDPGVQFVDSAAGRRLEQDGHHGMDRSCEGSPGEQARGRQCKSGMSDPGLADRFRVFGEDVDDRHGLIVRTTALHRSAFTRPQLMMAHLFR